MSVFSRLRALSSAVVCLGVTVAAQAPQFPSAAVLTPRVFGRAFPATAKGIFTYEYRLINDSRSSQPAIQLAVQYDSTLHITSISTPVNWSSNASIGGMPLVGWTARHGAMVQPGAAARGFSFECSSLPGIVSALVVGLIPLDQLPTFSEGDAPETLPGASVVDNSVHLRTIGPVTTPLDFKPVDFIQTIIRYKEQAIQLGWIKDHGIGISLDAKLNAALAALKRGENAVASDVLKSLLREIDERDNAERDNQKQLSPEAFALVKFNTKYLIGKISSAFDDDRERDRNRENQRRWDDDLH